MSVVSGVLVTGSSVVRDAGHVDMALDKAGCDRQQEAANAAMRWRLRHFLAARHPVRLQLGLHELVVPRWLSIATVSSKR